MESWNTGIREYWSRISYLNSNNLLKKSFSAGYSKMPRCKAPEILRSEAYLAVRWNDEG